MFSFMGISPPEEVARASCNRRFDASGGKVQHVTSGTKHQAADALDRSVTPFERFQKNNVIAAMR